MSPERPAPEHMAPEHLALRAKVDAFSEGVAARREDLTCHAGCSQCCEVELELSDVEAEAMRAGLREISPDVLREIDIDGPGCVLLDRATGRCRAYAARPLVCRTQGLPLRYPEGTLPEETVMGQAPGAEITWCPLNFREAPPEPADVLDAERVDVMLALLNRRASATPLRRTALRALVREATDGLSR